MMSETVPVFALNEYVRAMNTSSTQAQGVANKCGKIFAEAHLPDCCGNPRWCIRGTDGETFILSSAQLVHAKPPPKPLDKPDQE